MTAMIRGEHHHRVAYLVATALFILSLKWLSSPTTARRGVMAGELGMVLAIGGTLLAPRIVDYRWIAIALVLGTIIGVPLGMVPMTAVPQRTALEPRLRRALRHAGRHRRVLPARARRPAIHDGGARRWKSFSAPSPSPAA